MRSEECRGPGVGASQCMIGDPRTGEAFARKLCISVSWKFGLFRCEDLEEENTEGTRDERGRERQTERERAL